MRICRICERQFKGPGRTRCDECNTNDPHRHAGRKSTRKPRMFVGVDCEGIRVCEQPHKTRDETCSACVERFTTVSLGREDGTSASCLGSPYLTPKEIATFLISELAKLHNGSIQVPIAFHFKWDTSTWASHFDLDNFIVAERGQKIGHFSTQSAVGFCKQVRAHDDCKYPHRFDSKLIDYTILNGGESELMVYEPDMRLGFCATMGRRLYIELRESARSFYGSRRVDIHDVGSSFVGSLEKVIGDWQPELTTAERGIIAWGKRERKTQFADAPVSKVAAYSEAECVALARTARKLLNAMAELEIELPEEKLYGSGSIAASALKHYGIPHRKEYVADDVADDLAMLCYFGGIIDAPVIGRATGTVTQLDAASAYPAAMTQLPCMLPDCGEWITQKRLPPPSAIIGYVKAQWWEWKDTAAQPYLVRRKDLSVKAPHKGWNIWVTLAEFRAARDNQNHERMTHGVEYVYWKCTCKHGKPFAWMADLYNKRNAVKAQMKSLDSANDEWLRLSALEQAIKLVLNSCYGKLAQRQPQLGPFTNLHYAATITGMTRALIRRTAWQRESEGGTVLYFHTDSVSSIGGNPIGSDGSLGTMKLESECEYLLVAQAGLTHSPAKSATRGVGANEWHPAITEWANAQDMTRHPSEWTPCTVPIKRMLSYGLARMRNRRNCAGVFETSSMILDFGSGKRIVADAYQIPGQPELWLLPPEGEVPDYQLATIDDVRIPPPLLDGYELHNGELVVWQKLEAWGEDVVASADALESTLSD